jgi:transcriptional regulator GlxA family with amidase domain
VKRDPKPKCGCCGKARPSVQRRLLCADPFDTALEVNLVACCAGCFVLAQTGKVVARSRTVHDGGVDVHRWRVEP